MSIIVLTIFIPWMGVNRFELNKWFAKNNFHYNDALSISKERPGEAGGATAPLQAQIFSANF